MTHSMTGCRIPASVAVVDGLNLNVGESIISGLIISAINALGFLVEQMAQRPYG